MGMHLMKTTLAVLALAALATSGQAQEYVLGAGYADYNDDMSEDGALVVAEYHHTPFYETGRFDLSLAGALSLHLTGDAHIGVGISGTYDLNDRWFLEGSVLPGAYFENEDRNFIGGHFQIRSLIGLGYGFDNGNQVSLAIHHISNASTTNFNPGINAATLRLRRPF